MPSNKEIIAALTRQEALASCLQFQTLQNVHKRHAQDTMETVIFIYLTPVFSYQSITGTAFEHRALVTIVDIGRFLCMYCIL